MKHLYITLDSLISSLRKHNVRYNRHETEERTLITYTGADGLVFRFAFFKQEKRIDYSITLPCEFTLKADPWHKESKTRKLSGTTFTNGEEVRLDFTVEMREIAELHAKLQSKDYTL